MLDDKQKFMRTYFKEIKHYKKYEEQEEIRFEFPTVKMKQWNIEGFIRGEHVLLKGTDNRGKINYKKYNYTAVYEKVRKDYAGWATSKF